MATVRPASSSSIPFELSILNQSGATGYEAGNSEVQWRLPWYGGNGGPSQQGRVFVKPGVECNTLCNEWYLGKDGCKEVVERPACL